MGPAQVAALPAPVVTPLADRRVGDGREITVRLASQRPVRMLALDVRPAAGTVVGMRINGQAISQSAVGGKQLMVTFDGPPPSGLEATVTVSGAGPVDLRAVDGSDGLSTLPGFRPRPADVQAAGSHSSDLVLVAHTVRFG